MLSVVSWDGCGSGNGIRGVEQSSSHLLKEKQYQLVYALGVCVLIGAYLKLFQGGDPPDPLCIIYILFNLSRVIHMGLGVLTSNEPYIIYFPSLASCNEDREI